MPRQIRARALRAALAVVLLSAGLVVTAPGPAASAATCSVVDYYVVTTGSPQRLLRYTTGRRLVSSVTLPDPAQDYDSFTDVATNADGSVVYVKGDGPVLYAIDPATGASRRQPLTGPVLPETTSALTSLPDGRLLAGSYTKLYVIDPVTGTSTLDPRELPAGQRFNGDLTVLADGDVLALTAATDRVPGAFSNLTRVDAEGRSTVLGTVRSGQSITTSAGAVYLPSEDGTVRRLDPVPTRAGTGALPAAPLYGLGTRTVGAASVQDSGVCRPTFGVSLSEFSTSYGTPPQLIAYGLPTGARGTVTFTSRG